jgi:O-antigen ligase
MSTGIPESPAATASLGRMMGAVVRDARRRAAASADDWPRTGRILPWLVAGFLAVIWLVPFNSVSLAASLPIDLQFDRLVLPVVGVVWLAAVLAGGPGAPALRSTPVHVALGAFLVIALGSVVFNLQALNIDGELEQSFKKLVLLLAYAGAFAMVASVVRPTEVRAFSAYILVLACLCALGTIYEYRTEVNLFYDWTDQLLPGMFRVEHFNSGIDQIGRTLTRGPTQHGLEVVTILGMALPIACVGVMYSSRRRDQVLFCLAAAVLFAASVSTFRKTAFIAPAAGVFTLLALQPRRVMKLVPVGIAVLVVVHILSPGALGSVAVQLTSDRLNQASTVNGREADYDAIRPDVLSSPLVGRGYGSYDQQTYRILDSEYLHRLVETGVIGVVGYLALILSVIVAARRSLRAGDAMRAPPALAAAGAAGAFLVASALFDAVSFPHTPYVFLTIAGLAAVCAASPAPDRDVVSR